MKCKLVRQVVLTTAFVIFGGVLSAASSAQLFIPPPATAPGKKIGNKVARFSTSVVKVLPSHVKPGATSADTGFGIIIGSRGNDLYIATPHHVVWESPGDPPFSRKLTVEFEPKAGEDPMKVSAERLDTFKSEPAYDDLAVLVVRDGATYAPPAAPAVREGTGSADNTVFVFGRGESGWKVSSPGTWIEERIEPVREVMEGLPARRSMSGAAIAKPEGITGMLLATTDSNLEQVALPAWRIIERFEKWDLPTNLLTLSRRIKK